MSDTKDKDEKAGLDEFSVNDLAITRTDPMGTIAEACYAGILSYMRRPYTKNLTGYDVAIVGAPFDLAVTNRPGARFGPRAIRAASAQLSCNVAWGWDFDPFDRIKVADFGDLVFDPGKPMEIPALLSKQISEILDTGATTLMLGGDHFTAYPAIVAHAKKHGPLALIQFDSHSDTWRDDEDRIDHGTMFYRAIQEGLIVPEHSVQMGIRSDNVDTHGVNIFSAEWLRENGTKAAAAKIHEIVGKRPCYITFDIDFLDPAFAPGTGTPVIGGPSSAEARAILVALAGLNLKGMDIVEVSPSYDHAEITALAAATIGLDLLSIYAAQFD